jgi:phage tail sheath protein FI
MTAVSVSQTLGEAETWTITATSATTFSVNGFVSSGQPAATVGVPYNNGIIAFTINAGSTPFSTGDVFTLVISTSTTTNPLGANDAAKRVSIVTALQAEINTNSDVRSDYYEYNVILCPGYHEVVDELLNLNLAINEEAFIIADTPMNKTPEDTATWSMTAARFRSQNVAYYYPHVLASNLDGVDVLAAASGAALKTFAYTANVAEVWYPPAGFRRGVLTGVSNVGYVTGTLGTATTFVQAPLNQGQRDVLYEYQKNVNIIPYFPGRGFVVFGQKTSYSLTSALDRVNVMLLLQKLKREIRKASMAYLFELNDRITRDSIKTMIDDYLNDIMVRRGLYDYLVVCDETNNTPTRIDRNELWVDILVKPPKSIEFIYIPIRVVATGASI